MGRQLATKDADIVAVMEDLQKVLTSSWWFVFFVPDLIKRLDAAIEAVSQFQANGGRCSACKNPPCRVLVNLGADLVLGEWRIADVATCGVGRELGGFLHDAACEIDAQVGVFYGSWIQANPRCGQGSCRYRSMLAQAFSDGLAGAAIVRV
jgi:hypothetical protein